MARKAAKKLSLTDRLKNSGVREETRYKEVELPRGGSNVPANVTGIAKVTKIAIKPYKAGDDAGKLFLGVNLNVIEPAEAPNERVKLKDGTVQMVRIEGSLLPNVRRITLDDSKDYEGNTIPFEENFKEAENLLKLLGIDTESIEDEDFEETVPALPDHDDYYVRFRTWGREIEQGPNAGEFRVYTVIEGPAEEYEPEEVDDMTDETPAATKATTKSKSKGKAATKKSNPNDPTALGVAADDGDEDAEEALVELAEKHGIDHEAADSWSDVAKEIIEAMEDDEDEVADDEDADDEDGDDEDYEDEEDEEDEDEEDEEDDEYVPAKGDQVMYKPPRSRKKVECEVTAVYVKKQTVNLVSVDDPNKKYKGVSWDAIEEAV